jgi:hypothetical protein
MQDIIAELRGRVLEVQCVGIYRRTGEMIDDTRGTAIRGERGAGCGVKRAENEPTALQPASLLGLFTPAS